MRFILPIFFWFTFAYILLASDSYSVERIQPSNQFPVSEVTDIHLGNKGLLWLGTNSGLFYYDGYSIKSQHSLLFDSKDLTNDYIHDILQDDIGNIFLLTAFGIEKYHVLSKISEPILRLSSVEQTKFISIYNHLNILIHSSNSITRYSLESKEIDTLFQSWDSLFLNPLLAENSLWFIDGNQLIQLDLLDNTRAISPLPADINVTSYALQQFDSHNLVIAINNELYKYNISTGNYLKIARFSNAIEHLSEVLNNNMVVTTKDDVFLLSVFENGYSDPIKLYGFNKTQINDVLLDSSGLVWIAASQSVLKINPYSKVFDYQTILNEKIDNASGSNIVTESEKLGFAYTSFNGESYFYLAPEDLEIMLPISDITSICLIDSRLVFANNESLYSLDLEKNQYIQLSDTVSINTISRIGNEFWITSSTGIYRLDGNKLVEICGVGAINIFPAGEDVYLIDEKGISRLNEDLCRLEVLLPDSLFNAKVNITDILQSYDGKTWIATNSGLYQFIPDTTATLSEQFVKHYSGKVYSLIEAAELPEIWFSTDIGLGAINYRTNEEMFFGYTDGVEFTSFINKCAFLDSQGFINFVSTNQKVNFDPKQVYRRTVTPEVYISFANFYGLKQTQEIAFFSSDTLVVSPDIRLFELELTTFDYFSQENTAFSYSLEPFDAPAKWKVVEGKNKLSIGRLSAGKYKLLIKAKNSHGLESKVPRSIVIFVKAPLLQTRWAYFIYFITIIIMVVLLIRIRTRNLRRINREYKDKERIAKKIEVQKEELTLKNKNITDSINYARRIQLAMMPSDKLFSSVFPDSFILHIPKDIVSGDFYWINQVEDKTFFSAVDCTGHGVPGAFMSIIGVELFRRITEIEGISTPAEVLNSLSRNFERVFGDVDEMKLRDGMDLAFCSLNEDFTLLEYAGAFNPLYIVRDSSIMEIKGDRHSVGVYEKDDNIRYFNNHVIPLKDGDIIYIFTDGFADQFGGPEGKKYKYRRFRHLLLALHQLPMEKQADFLKKSILEWKGDLDQVDDILVMGLRIHQKKI
ncbi:MAG TPA: hypothetical protein DDX98_06035 [Bacteroidales bacterium]|jgi:serine phosphatase RsbU (regulator of sigma subunit)/ligand-binding sensor domain-containing protein|nr:hypothetical protein [Bacteroidales bacterium]